MISRERALELLHQNLHNQNLRRHVYAVEAVMRELARRLDQDPDVFGITGLLHDLDYELTVNDPEKHTWLTRGWLESEPGVNGEMLHAIHAHAGHVERVSIMDKAIYCADPVTGFIVASTLMHPSKSIAALEPDFLMRRFKEKRFAAGANREQIASCGELGFELEEFLLLARDSMASISSELGFA